MAEPAAGGTFVARHLGPGETDQAEMLKALGLPDVDELLDLAVPAPIRQEEPLTLPAALSEGAVLEGLRDLAERNETITSYIGLGYANTRTPAVILRNVLENPAWYTAYTPYQSEISQGRLEALLTFQTMVADLTGMDIANASLLDEATAAAEAMAMCRRIGPRPGSVFAVDRDVFPQTLAVLRTRARGLGIDIDVRDLRRGEVPDDAYGVLLQQPGAGGTVHDDSDLIARLHECGTKVAVATDLLAATVLVPPGEQGADVVVGNSQRFGVPLMFGGPHAAFLAAREGDVRSLPGRLVGVSRDARGRDAFRLALQTREQHIRRERATSNICTSQVLLAVVAAMYGVYHGPDGLRRIARRVAGLTGLFARGLDRPGLEVVNDTFFDTVTVRAPGRAAALLAGALEAGYNLRPVDEDTLAVTLDETTRVDDVAALLDVFGCEVDVAAAAESAGDGIPTGCRRDSDFLTHEVFHAHRSETAMLRYLRRLSDRDVALDRTMIPLGSCTMKLNAAAEMLPITWPGFTDVHPFAPLDQADGYVELIRDLERMLAEITGYAKVSVQPNAGSQGELAGLLAIRAYHDERGDDDRDVCLIPESAHGTNAASATMAGMRVEVVDCDDDGNVDVDDLRHLAEEHAETLAALMVTYPSTHGVFEQQIRDICRITHDAGGQVYLDGANLNALVGVARPGHFGADVSHLNLHKTFCIPHGGGGPGVGPVAVAPHLAPYLPGHPLRPECGPDEGGIGPVSAAPWGSAGVLPISYAYLRLMGGQGLRRATEVAILAANYLAERLRRHYPVLYTGAHGFVAHECIVDLREVESETGITNEDVAKRLIDYGFHAPTMSFPVAGTLMIEPTESEPKEELDRFCDAMIAIRREIDRVAGGEWPADDNPLVNAPHTAEDLVGEWRHPYDRATAVFPEPSSPRDKYWPPVNRVDNAYGDRNLMCACPPMDAYR